MGFEISVQLQIGKILIIRQISIYKLPGILSVKLVLFKTSIVFEAYQAPPQTGCDNTYYIDF